MYQKASLARLKGFEIETNPSNFKTFPNLPIILEPIQDPKETPHIKTGPLESLLIYLIT